MNSMTFKSKNLFKANQFAMRLAKMGLNVAMSRRHGVITVWVA